jgi:hypothetical protein
VILVMSIDPATGRAAAASVPRWVLSAVALSTVVVSAGAGLAGRPTRGAFTIG